jgi:osmoprotectant transport system permease protein
VRNLGAYFVEHADQVWSRTWEHLQITLTGLAITAAFAIPLGIWLTRRRALAGPVFAVANVVQTFPTLALLILMIPVAGIGTAPAVLALIVRAVFPLIRNTYMGILQVPVSVTATARAMGMTDRQVLVQVQLPLAASIILAGLRSSVIMAVALATLGAAIGGGGLGDFIFAGIAMRDDTQLLAGALPVALLAVVLDAGAGRVEAWVGRATRVQPSTSPDPGRTPR